MFKPIFSILNHSSERVDKRSVLGVWLVVQTVFYNLGNLTIASHTKIYCDWAVIFRSSFPSGALTNWRHRPEPVRQVLDCAPPPRPSVFN